MGRRPTPDDAGGRARGPIELDDLEHACDRLAVADDDAQELPSASQSAREPEQHGDAARVDELEARAVDDKAAGGGWYGLGDGLPRARRLGDVQLAGHPRHHDLAPVGDVEPDEPFAHRLASAAASARRSRTVVPSGPGETLTPSIRAR